MRRRHFDQRRKDNSNLDPVPWLRSELQRSMSLNLGSRAPSSCSNHIGMVHLSWVVKTILKTTNFLYPIYKWLTIQFIFKRTAADRRVDFYLDLFLNTFHFVSSTACQLTLSINVLQNWHHLTEVSKCDCNLLLTSLNRYEPTNENTTTEIGSA